MQFINRGQITSLHTNTIAWYRTMIRQSPYVHFAVQHQAAGPITRDLTYNNALAYPLQ